MPRREPSSASRKKKLFFSASSVASHSAATPPPGSCPKMMISPSQLNAAEWPTVTPGIGDVIEQLRIVQRAAQGAAEAEDVHALAAGAGRLHDVAQDHTHVVAGVVERLGADQARAARIVQWDLDDVDAVAHRPRRASRRPPGRLPCLGRAWPCATRTATAPSRPAPGRLVRDVEDVHAFPACRHGLPVAGQAGAERPRRAGGGVPRADERGGSRRRCRPGSRRRTCARPVVGSVRVLDVPDREPVPVALVGVACPRTRCRC